jgi:serine phosphatase RsbU (regulator of sigma subunit)/CheY-like chemotaxis protein
MFDWMGAKDFVLISFNPSLDIIYLRVKSTLIAYPLLLIAPMSQANEKLKLMVVDDEPDNLDLLYRTFRREFRVFKADSGVSALYLLQQEGEMAIIISDQRMPMMNGTEFLSKTVDRFPETIRILLTGYTDVEDLVDAINTGQVFKYITKPWNPENLKNIVQQAAETYKIVKKRTDELRRVLRRESILNAVISAIRESLDYSSMLNTVVKTMGITFNTHSCLLYPVENQTIITEQLVIYPDNKPEIDQEINTEKILENVITNKQKEILRGKSENSQYTYVVLPLICQQQLLAILTLYHDGKEPAWTEQELQLMESVADQTALALSQAKLYQHTQQQAEQMRAELEVARQIQSNLLRQTLPIVEGVNLQACCYPARQVGGDFFEIYHHPQGDIWLAVGDVSGKGVPAALFMASAISVLRRELSQENSPDPHVVMQNLNHSLNEDLASTNCFITMLLAKYNLKTKKIVYANAGHVYPLVWSQTELATNNVQPKLLNARGIPLGILPIWKGQIGEVSLNNGEVFLLTSDGITEATITNPSTKENLTDLQVGSMLKPEGLWQMILQESIPLNLTNLLNHLRELAEVQEDDQTILSLEVL